MDLPQFLVKAKIATYASEATEMALEDGAKELTFQNGEFKYRDRYYGTNPFVGQEIVWKNNRLIWSMNYFGKILSGVVSEKEVYKFLQRAMKQVKEDRPFRGSSNFKIDDFEYIDESTGDVNNFIGTERILFKEEEIYRLNYHGGSMYSAGQ